MFEPEDFEVLKDTWTAFVRQAVLKGTVDVYNTDEKNPISIVITRVDRTHEDVYDYKVLVHNEDYVKNRKGRGSYLPPSFTFYGSVGRSPTMEEILSEFNKGKAFQSIIHWIFI